MKFKEYIQSEVNRKEYEPSHDAWDRIQARMENQAPVVVIEKSSKKWWAIAAAVIGLAVCTTVYFSMTKDNFQPEMVINHENNSKIKKSSNSKLEDQTPVEILNQIEEQQESKIANSKSISTPVSESVSEEKEQMVSNQVQDSKGLEDNRPQTIQKPAIANGLKSIPVPQQVATNLDTVNVKQKKKGSYVDPSMLLYSIENKEALKETQKEKTRVAVIDLNK